MPQEKRKFETPRFALRPLPNSKGKRQQLLAVCGEL